MSFRPHGRGRSPRSQEPINPARFPSVVLKYRAKNITAQRRFVLRFEYGSDGLYYTPISTKELQDDGGVHTLRVNLQGGNRFRFHDAFTGLELRVDAGKSAPAEFELLGLRFERPEPDGRDWPDTFEIRVVDEKTGEPIAHAPLSVSIRCGYKDNRYPWTDEDGIARIGYDKEKLTYIGIEVHAPGRVPMDRDFRTERDVLEVPDRYTIRGRVVDESGEPIRGALVSGDTWRGNRAFNPRTRTDADGRFVFDRVPPGKEVKVMRTVSTGEHSWSYQHRREIETKPGGTHIVKLGGSGRAVVGRIARVEAEELDSADLFAETRGTLSTKLAMPEPPRPDGYEQMSDEEKRAWYERWKKTEEGQAYQEKRERLRKKRRSYSFAIGPDGSFRVPDVPAGEYKLSVQLYKPSGRGPRRPEDLVALVQETVTVPSADQYPDVDPVQLGSIEPAAVTRLEVGDEAPGFEVATVDGEKVSLKDYRGKYVLLDFWATWCGPCLEQTPDLKAVHERFGDDPRFAMLGLSLDKEPEAPKRYAKENGLGWTQGFLGAWDETDLPERYGVRGIPAIVLIGPEGEIVAKGLRGDEIERAVADALATGG